MKLLSIGMAGLALGGCAPRTLAALVPRLDLQLELGKLGDDRVAASRPGAAPGYVVLGARLRWQPAWTTSPSTVASRIALLGPCDAADADCLAEQLAVASAMTEAR